MVARADAILFSGGAPGRRGRVRRGRRAARDRGSQLLLRWPQAGADARPARAQSRGAARRRSQPRLRVAADEPPLPRHADLPQDPPEHLVSDQQRPGDLRRRRDRGRQTVRGGTGWGAEFAKLCNKPLFVFDQAKRRLVRVGRRRVAGPRAAPSSRRSVTRTSPAPARVSSTSTAAPPFTTSSHARSDAGLA